MNDYKDSIHLPKTDFPMKGNLPTREPEILRQWTELGLYQKMLGRNRDAAKFSMPDGPPYANGSIHIGHALNKILKDIVIKYKNMSGLHAAFIPGWDCHGLPIEHKVLKTLAEEKKDLSEGEILQRCRQEAQQWVNVQKEQFKRLGILADWDHPYLTMDSSFEAEEVREFARAFETGLIYQGKKPVYWCWALQTALAENEVEYHEHTSPAIYVQFHLSEESQKSLDLQSEEQTPVSFVIWTTTPWTLPANLAIALGEKIKYGLHRTEKGLIIVASALKEAIEKEIGLQLTPLGREWLGSELAGLRCRHPFIDRDSLVVLGEHVTTEAGTGCVHIAPGHGQDDYQVGLKYSLETYSPVNEEGKFTEEVPEFQGLHIFKANPLIIEKIEQKGALLHQGKITHSYPHCWRSKTPLIFRATAQWFIAMDQPERSLRSETLANLEKIQFVPEWGRARLSAMLENRPDWCVSRQRIWGVPIPIFYCIRTGRPLADVQVMKKVADYIEENGLEAYWTASPEAFLEGDYTDGDFGSEGFRKGRDILDVWFDSGIVHAAIQKKMNTLELPADIYLEGSDQHRGWFNSSLLTSQVTNGRPPYKALITHGFVNDAEGKKMSKSKGNTVDPQEVCSQMGAEILRLWTVYEDYGQDMTCGQDLLKRVSETYRRIRNTLRFMLGACYDFDPSCHSMAYENLTEIDQWALHELNQVTRKVNVALDSYEFYKVYHTLNQFFTVTLSATYLDVLKDRLYTGKTDGNSRRSSQTAIYLISHRVIRLMAPILSFIAEEAYGHLPGSGKESVFLEPYPEFQGTWERRDLHKRFKKVLAVRSDVSKALEDLRNQKVIGSSLDAQVHIQAEGEILEALRSTQTELRELFIVSKVDLQEGPYSIRVEKAEGAKCPRCWHYSVDVDKDERFPGVCPKCVEALA